MALRTGPLIEGVVSPTASSTTRQKALESAKDYGSTTDQIKYATAEQLFNQGASTSAVGAALSAPQTGTMAGQQLNTYTAMVNAGWQQNPDGTWTHAGTGKQTDATGTTLINDPVGPVGPGGPGVVNDPDTGQPTGPPGLGQVSQEAIEAQINALTAQYGLDLEGIAALGGEIGAQARFLLAQLQRDQGFAQEDLLGNLVGRGVFRSGITARDTGRLQGDFAARRAQVEMNKGQQLRQLAERAGLARVALARGKADTISQIDAGNLPAEIRQALLNELNSLTPQRVEQALANSRGPLPELELTDEDLRNRQTVGTSGVNLGGF